MLVVFKKSIVTILMSAVLIFSTLAFAEQATTPIINHFKSEITVNPDASLNVTEIVNISTDGKTIQHGIYRDFPTDYKTSSGKQVRVTFKVVNALLNGQLVQYQTNKMSNGIRVYLGSKDKYLPAGNYSFTLAYTTSGQLGFFHDHDELYWNVTGNGWEFPIATAQAVVKLPAGAMETVTDYTAYTGYQGSRDNDFQASMQNNSELVFVTTKPLAPKQGITIVVGWKKGFVTPPRFGIEDILLYGLLTLLAYYFVVWFKFGRDPKLDTVIPEYTPPSGFSPAALRYILEMGYDVKVFAAAVLNLAVQGFLKIEETANKKYLLVKQPKYPGTLSKAEQVLGISFFQEGVVFDLNKDAATVTAVNDDYKKELRQEFASKYFATNYQYSIIGALIAITIMLLAGWFSQSFEQFFVIAPLAIPLVLLYTYSTQLTGIRRIWSLFVAVFMLVFLGFFAHISLPLTQFILYFAIIAVTVLFWYLLKRPTDLGQKLNAHTRGFKLFLEATEKDRMNFRNPPERTPELFEKYLPYAIALGVEQKWSEQFTEILAQANYQPSWYVNNYSVFSAAQFSHSICNSFVGAVSSAANPPGSSSGFGGGGSSGGGGGGGGGGGW